MGTDTPGTTNWHPHDQGIDVYSVVPHHGGGEHPVAPVSTQPSHTGERNPGIFSPARMASEDAVKQNKAAHDYSSVDAPGNAGAGEHTDYVVGRGYFGPHGTGTELNKVGYDAGQYGADHAVPPAGTNMADPPMKTPFRQ